MQYILTENEYKGLINQGNLTRKIVKNELQKLCTMVADHALLSKPYGWKEGDSLTIQRCILTVKDEHYCDKCPVSDICPCDNKHWSK